MIHSDSHGWISFDDALPPASALEVLVAFKHKSDTYTGVGRIEVFDQADEGFPNPRYPYIVMHIAYLDNNNIIYIEVPSLSNEIDDSSAQLLAWQPLPPLPKQQ